MINKVKIFQFNVVTTFYLMCFIVGNYQEYCIIYFYEAEKTKLL